MHSDTERQPTLWRVEGSLVNLSAVRPVAFFTWNVQTFLGRWARRGGVALSAVVRPFLYAAHRVFATRVLHTLLRGVSRDPDLRWHVLGAVRSQLRLHSLRQVAIMQVLPRQEHQVAICAILPGGGKLAREAEVFGRAPNHRDARFAGAVALAGHEVIDLRE